MFLHSRKYLLYCATLGVEKVFRAINDDDAISAAVYELDRAAMPFPCVEHLFSVYNFKKQSAPIATLYYRRCGTALTYQNLTERPENARNYSCSCSSY